MTSESFFRFNIYRKDLYILLTELKQFFYPVSDIVQRQKVFF